MMWKITGQGGRYATLGGDGFAADAATLAEVAALAGAGLPATPTGPTYYAEGTDDPVWLYLAASRVIPGPRQATGTPPTVPVPPAVPDAVY